MLCRDTLYPLASFEFDCKAACCQRPGQLWRGHSDADVGGAHGLCHARTAHTHAKSDKVPSVGVCASPAAKRVPGMLSPGAGQRSGPVMANAQAHTKRHQHVY